MDPTAPPTPGPEPLPPVITLIGTGHVFDIGARVREEVRRTTPQLVGIELDPPRYHALRNRNKDKKGIPLTYRLLADFQARIADAYGVEAGDEMLAAAEEARALGVPLALIDVDAQKAFARLRKEMGFREKMRFLGSVLGGALLPGKSIEGQVDEMQENYALYFNEMGKKFPTLKRILLDERNEHMARSLAELSRTHARVAAVMGDGHVDGVRDILAAQGLQVEVVRLKDLRKKAEEPKGTATATLSVEVPAVSPPPRELK
jgi:pheromone shutdown protein TraB